MRFQVRAVACAAALATAAASCNVPTDKSKDIQVLVRLSDTLKAHGVLGRAERDSLFAVAVRQSTGDTIHNVDFAWSTSDPKIATVAGGAGGSAEVTGVNIGVATISARAVAFENAQVGDTLVRVAQAFVIDSVRPKSVLYGEKLTVYGVGLGSIFGLLLGGGELIPDPFSFSGSDVGLAQRQYWVPFPSSTERPTYFNFGGGQFIIGQVADSVTVDTVDIYEPNDTVQASLIDLNGTGGPRLFAGLPVLFFNPALYYEPLDLGSIRYEWYRFLRSDTTQAVTLLLESTSGDTAFSYLSDTLFWDRNINNYNFPASGWGVSPGFYYWCDNQYFTPLAVRSPSPVIALRELPTTHLHLVTYYQKEGGYQMTWMRGYALADRRIGPDRFEENDIWCRFVDRNFLTSSDSTSPKSKHIVVGLAPILGGNGAFFDSTLTIDNPGDIDWIRFRVQGSAFAFDTVTTIATKALPLGLFDASDIAVYVMRASDFSFMGGADVAGSSESVTLKLPPGDYYLGVLDVVNQETRYSVCIVKGTACTPLGVARPATIAPAVLARPRQPLRDPTVIPEGMRVPGRVLSRHP